ncbi:hypothetical protein M885DRAFT_550845 [Pelagophyceae sp. CCMP2097]|nr:hypothetical protein M885DRAFT_550845 [Pelagophyceae sp. CCMP2097]
MSSLWGSVVSKVGQAVKHPKGALQSGAAPEPRRDAALEKQFESWERVYAAAASISGAVAAAAGLGRQAHSAAEDVARDLVCLALTDDIRERPSDDGANEACAAAAAKLERRVLAAGAVVKRFSAGDAGAYERCLARRGAVAAARHDHVRTVPGRRPRAHFSTTQHASPTRATTRRGGSGARASTTRPRSRYGPRAPATKRSSTPRSATPRTPRTPAQASEKRSANSSPPDVPPAPACKPSGRGPASGDGHHAGAAAARSDEDLAESDAADSDDSQWAARATPSRAGVASAAKTAALALRRLSVAARHRTVRFRSASTTSQRSDAFDALSVQVDVFEAAEAAAPRVGAAVSQVGEALASAAVTLAGLAADHDALARAVAQWLDEAPDETARRPAAASAAVASQEVKSVTSVWRLASTRFDACGSAAALRGLADSTRHCRALLGRRDSAVLEAQHYAEKLDALRCRDEDGAADAERLERNAGKAETAAAALRDLDVVIVSAFADFDDHRAQAAGHRVRETSESLRAAFARLWTDCAEAAALLSEASDVQATSGG